MSRIKPAKENPLISFTNEMVLNALQNTPPSVNRHTRCSPVEIIEEKRKTADTQNQQNQQKHPPRTHHHAVIL